MNAKQAAALTKKAEKDKLKADENKRKKWFKVNGIRFKDEHIYEHTQG